MSFDTLALAAVRDELEPLLVDGRIQKLAFPDELSLGLEVFAPGAGRTEVVLSAHPETGRVQRLPRLPARGLERDTPFALVARKHLRNARISSIRQLPLERVLEVECDQRDDAGRHYDVRLIVEAMGRWGNLLLVLGDGTILDAVRRTPPSRNPTRPILPHLPYRPPPGQARLDPTGLSPAALADGARGHGGALARYLRDTVAGLSPLASRELAFRATGQADGPLAQVDWQQVAEAAAGLFAPLRTHLWQPTLATRGDEALAYAAYRLDHLAADGATLEMAPSMSAAIAGYQERQGAAGAGRGRDPLVAEKRALAKPLERALGQTERRIRALEQQRLAGERNGAPLRRAGEGILAEAWRIMEGAAEVEVDGQPVPLDPSLSAVENAQQYFARYRKAREATERVPPLLEEARQKEAYLQQLSALVDVADAMDAVRALRREVAAAVGARAVEPRPDRGARAGGGAVSRSRSDGAATAAGPYRRVPLGDSWEVLVGGSAAGNVAVTFGLAQPRDYWLHARGIPGAHVILRRANGAAAGEPPNETLARAAALAAWHSAGRSAGAVDVDYVERRQVRKIANGPPGLVRYAGERTLRVQAAPG